MLQLNIASGMGGPDLIFSLIIPHSEILLSLSFFFPVPLSVPKFWRIPKIPKENTPLTFLQISHCILDKSRDSENTPSGPE